MKWLRRKTNNAEQPDQPEQEAPKATNLPRLLEVPDVVAATGLQAWRIYELCAAKQIPHMRIGGRIRFSEHELAKWIEDEHRRNCNDGS